MITDVTLRTATAADAAALSLLALRSKGHWGYSDAVLEAFVDELTVHPEQCDGVHVVIAERDGLPLGYYRLAGTRPRGELADLFVDPPAIGQGVGTLLLRDALWRARGLGLEVLRIDADPNAEAFYLRAGATRVGEVSSGSISGRLLPQLDLVVPR